MNTEFFEIDCDDLQFPNLIEDTKSTLMNYMTSLYEKKTLYKKQADKIFMPSILLKNTKFENKKVTTTDFIFEVLTPLYESTCNTTISGMEFYWYKHDRRLFKNVKQQKDDILWFGIEYLKEYPDNFRDRLFYYLGICEDLDWEYNK